MKIGRNDACPCGSGKKYKHCCQLDAGRSLEAKVMAEEASAKEATRRRLMRGTKVYTLRVELERMAGRPVGGPVSRTLEMSGEHSLYDLHLQIQHSSDWDNDHMFSFYLPEAPKSRRVEYKGGPLGEWEQYDGWRDSKSAADTELDDLGLTPRRKFTYLSDYGDRLEHRVTVRAVRSLEKGGESCCRIVATEGTPPLQYGPMQE